MQKFARFPGGEKGAESCHASICHGCFGPDIIFAGVWDNLWAFFGTYSTLCHDSLFSGLSNELPVTMSGYCFHILFALLHAGNPCVGLPCSSCIKVMTLTGRPPQQSPLAVRQNALKAVSSDRRQLSDSDRYLHESSWRGERKSPPTRQCCRNFLRSYRAVSAGWTYPFSPHPILTPPAGPDSDPKKARGPCTRKYLIDSLIRSGA